MIKPDNPKVGTKYRLLQERRSIVNGYLPEGTIVTLHRDDNTECPWFIAKKVNRNSFAINWSNMIPILTKNVLGGKLLQASPSEGGQR